MDCTSTHSNFRQELVATSEMENLQSKSNARIYKLKMILVSKATSCLKEACFTFTAENVFIELFSALQERKKSILKPLKGTCLVKM